MRQVVIYIVSYSYGVNQGNTWGLQLHPNVWNFLQQSAQNTSAAPGGQILFRYKPPQYFPPGYPLGVDGTEVSYERYGQFKICLSIVYSVRR